MSGGDTSEHGPPPPPPPPSGSPFGRFLTAPVLMGAALAIVVSFVALRFVPGETGGNGATAPVPSGIEGSWEGPGVRLEVTRTGGTMTERDCRGVLMPRAVEGVFDYTETSGRRGCPRRRVVRLSLVDRDTLRVDEGRGERDVAPTTLRRAG